MFSTSSRTFVSTKHKPQIMCTILPHTTRHPKIKHLIITLLTVFFTLQGQQFTPTVTDGKKITEESTKTLINEIENSTQSFKTEEKTDSLIIGLIKLSQLHRSALDYRSAFDHAGEALFMSEQYGDSKLLSLALAEYGILNYLFKQDNTTAESFTRSLAFAKKAYQEGTLTHEELYPAYYHQILKHQRSDNLVELQHSIDTCQQFIDRYQWGIEKQIYLNEKIAYLNHRINKKEEANTLLKETGRLLDNNEELREHQSFLIIIYGVLANNLFRQGDKKEAFVYFEKALDIEDEYGENTFYIEFLHTEYANKLYKSGQHEQAYKHMQQAKWINDSFLNPRKEATQGLLSVKNRYREELEQRNKTLQRQAVKIAEQKSKLWQTRVFIFIIILLFTIAVFMMLRKRQQHKHQMENTAFLERRRHNEALIEHKNKELTSNILQLIEKEEIIKKLSDALKEEAPNAKTKSLLKTIDQQSTSLWDAFNARFMEQNADFYARLKEKAPNLSSADLKICALIKLNFSGKEMAYLLGISEGSVHVARHRLRKKFQIGRDVNLVQLINNL